MCMTASGSIMEEWQLQLKSRNQVILHQRLKFRVPFLIFKILVHSLVQFFQISTCTFSHIVLLWMGHSLTTFTLIWKHHQLARGFSGIWYCPGMIMMLFIEISNLSTCYCHMLAIGWPSSVSLAVLKGCACEFTPSPLKRLRPIAGGLLRSWRRLLLESMRNVTCYHDLISFELFPHKIPYND